jgi:hypothetical protein
MTFKYAVLTLMTGLLAYSHTAAAAAQSDMSVEINVALTKKAADRLAAEKEGMVAFADYSAPPKNGMAKAAKKIDAMGPDGMVSLQATDEHVQISGTGGTARITGKNIDQKRLAWITGPVNININVASARKSSNEENFLQCDFIDGPLSKVQKQPITVHCGLIKGDSMETTRKP